MSLWLTGLLLLWAALLFGGFVFGRVNAERTGRMPLWTRLASSAVLVLAAWSGYAVSRGTTTSLFALLIAVGMTLGMLGDLLMARLLAVAQYMLLGMGAFGLGHVAYIAAGLVYGNQHGLAEAGPRYSVWAIWLVAGLIGWYFAVFRGQPKRSALHWVALPYALLLASTAGVATGLAIQEAALWPMAVGAALFLVSDLILAARLFNGLLLPVDRRCDLADLRSRADVDRVQRGKRTWSVSLNRQCAAPHRLTFEVVPTSGWPETSKVAPHPNPSNNCPKSRAPCTAWPRK